MKEIWKDIIGYEKLYQVSNLGNIKSIKRNIILKPATNHKGYLLVCLKKGNTKKTFSIHRLVSEAFIPNLNNKSQVNHINCLKTDNRIENLEWNTQSENQKHAFANGLQTNVGDNNPRCRKINQYDLDGNFIKTWNSIYDITEELGYSRSSIWRCCIGKYNKSHNFIWRYAD